jgi:DNA-binding NarL/FixJ family response regulator
MRIVIADDHEIFRDGLSLMLSRQKDIELAGEADNGLQLVEMVRRLQPDVIITDIKMPIMDGLEATRILLKEFPGLKIIALSMFDEENLVVDMLEAGAKGYLQKNADKTEIVEAINTVYTNNTYYCRRTTSKLASLIAKSKYSWHVKKNTVTFSERELGIIKLICQQQTAQQIADTLFLSRRTIEGYRIKILEKMNAKTTAGVVVYALKHGIIAEKDLQ